MQNNKSKLNIVLAVLIILLLAVLIFRSRDSDVVPVDNNNNMVEPTNAPVGLNILGNKDDLIFTSIKPGDTVSGDTSFSASVKGGYFFEANIIVNVLDANKNVIQKGNATARGEWMKDGPVPFDMGIDFTNLKKGPGYIQIKNDNPSDNRQFDKEILIPVIIK